MPRSDFSGYPRTVDTTALRVYLDEHLVKLYSEAYRGLKLQYPDAKESIREIAAWDIVAQTIRKYGEGILRIQEQELQFYLKHIWRCNNCKSKETPVFYRGNLVCSECAHEYPADSSLLREMSFNESIGIPER